MNIYIYIYMNIYIIIYVYILSYITVKWWLNVAEFYAQKAGGARSTSLTRASNLPWPQRWKNHRGSQMATGSPALRARADVENSDCHNSW